MGFQCRTIIFARDGWNSSLDAAIPFPKFCNKFDRPWLLFSKAPKDNEIDKHGYSVEQLMLLLALLKPNR